METLVVLNSLVNLVLISYVIYKKVLRRIRVEWDRTFWTKKIIGITFWWMDSDGTSGTGKTYNFAKESKTDYDEYKKNGATPNKIVFS